MVRSSARSAGCSTCRYRRVKCDEASPVCTPCRVGNRVCSGPRREPFFVHAVPDPKTRDKITANRQASSNELVDMAIGDWRDPFYQPHSTVKPYSTVDMPRSDTLEDTKLCCDPILPVTVSNIRAYEQQFFSCYFDGFGYCVETLAACSWLSKLPLLLTRACSLPTLQYCARATCMAYYGRLTNDREIETAAINLYQMGLLCQRKMLSKPNAHLSVADPDQVASEDSICATILMAHFELVMGGSLDSWAQHMDAAAALLAARKAQFCQFGMVHQLFRTVRLGTICSSILKRKPHRIATNEWSTARYQASKNSLDCLLDILELFPDVLSEYTLLIGSKIDPTHIKANVNWLSQKLNEWHRNYKEILGDDRFYQSYREHATKLPTCTSVLGAAQMACLPLQTKFDDQANTLLLCLFNAGCAVASGMLSTLEPDNSEFRTNTLLHCGNILSATAALDCRSSASVSSVYMLAVFPMRVVAAWSPCAKQRGLADQKTGHYLEQSQSVEAA